MRHLAELALYRQELLARCNQQRAELSAHLAGFRPRRVAGGAADSRQSATGLAARHPLASLVVLAAVLLLRKPRQALVALGWARAGMSLLSKTSEILNLLTLLRRPRR